MPPMKKNRKYQSDQKVKSNTTQKTPSKVKNQIKHQTEKIIYLIYRSILKLIYYNIA